MKKPPDADGLTTERLVLRRFVPGDLDWFARLNGDPEIKKHMGGPASREVSARVLRERVLDYYGEHPGMGMWVTVERASGKRAGFHLVNNIQGEPDIQVGYVLDRPFWGRGYATEMCFALVRYAFTELALAKLAGIVNLGNVASQNVLLKCGLRRRGERAFKHPAYADVGPMAYFERDAEDWLAEFGASPRLQA